MASSLFGGGQPNGIFSRVDAIRRMVGGNPDAAFDSLMRTNPRFADFVRQNQGKTPEQIASEHGIDVNLLRQLV